MSASIAQTKPLLSWTSFTNVVLTHRQEDSLIRERIIELNARYAVPEWDGQEVRFALEEDAALLEDGWDWIDGRQTSFYLIR